MGYDSQFGLFRLGFDNELELFTNVELFADFDVNGLVVYQDLLSRQYHGILSRPNTQDGGFTDELYMM